MTYMRIALRNLNRQKKRTFLLGGAISFGIMIVTILNGFTGSLVRNVGENFAQLTGGHIFVTGLERTESGKSISIIREGEELLGIIEDENPAISHVSRKSSFSGNILFEGRSAFQNIDGVDWEQEALLRNRLVLRNGSFEAMKDRRAIMLSSTIADKLDVEVGDILLIQLSTITGQQNVGEFVLGAISHDPGIFGSISAYAGLPYVNELLNIPEGRFMTLGILLGDLSGVDAGAEAIHSALEERVQVFGRPNASETSLSMTQAWQRELRESQWEGTKYRVTTINDFLSQLIQIVGVLNSLGFVVLLVLFLIIMVGITNTFRMIMYERTREIGTMRALGMQRSAVRRLFLYEALFLALGGAAAGLVSAWFSMTAVGRMDLGSATALSLFLKNGRLTFSVTAVQVLMNVGLIGGLSLAAAFFPAKKAAKLEPAQALSARP